MPKKLADLESGGAPVRDEPLAVELANTVHAACGRRLEGLEAPEHLARWILDHRGRPEVNVPDADLLAVGTAELSLFHSLRAAIRGLFHAHVSRSSPHPPDLALVNRLCPLGDLWPVLLWPGSGTPSVEARGTADPITCLQGRIARSTVHVLGDERDRLRLCSAPGCVLFFLADGRRRWCSGACGNRARVARHSERRSDESL